MNLVCHALVATWWSAQAPFVLGAALPDLARMAQAAHFIPLDPEVEQGVALHHRTDARFHGLPSFQQLLEQSRQRLEELGLRRGQTKAAAHVGLELLLDAAVADRPGPREALRVAVATALCRPGWLFWPEAVSEQAFARVCEVLLARDFGLDDLSSEAVARRVTRVLAARPRLELLPDEQSVLSKWAGEIGPVVRGRSSHLFEELAFALGRRAKAAD